MEQKDAIVEIYTDGACRGNPGPGGWSALLRYQGKERELFGAEPYTTNNRMELMAAIAALEALRRPCQVILHTDSRYLKRGVTEWLPCWIQRGWRTASRKPVKNLDLWQRLLQAMARHQIQWEWVRGHSGHPENDRVDQLANRAMEQMLSQAPKP